MLLIEPLDVL